MKAGDLLIDESEIVETFVRASGPGGQNVNKVATRGRDAFRRAPLAEPARRRRGAADEARRGARHAGRRDRHFRPEICEPAAQSRGRARPPGRPDREGAGAPQAPSRHPPDLRLAARAASTTSRAAAPSKRCGARAPARTERQPKLLKRREQIASGSNRDRRREERSDAAIQKAQTRGANRKEAALMVKAVAGYFLKGGATLSCRNEIRVLCLFSCPRAKF